MERDLPPAPVLAYATPLALNRQRTFRDGDLVVKAKGADFPPRCVRCNAPANRGLRVNMRHDPWLKLVLKTVYRNISVPLCDEHFEHARRLQRTSLALAVTGIGLYVLLMPLAALGIVPGSAAVVVVPAAIALVFAGDRVRERRSPLRIVRVTKTHLYFAGACEAFVASLDSPR